MKMLILGIIVVSLIIILLIIGIIFFIRRSRKASSENMQILENDVYEMAESEYLRPVKNKTPESARASKEAVIAPIKQLHDFYIQVITDDDYGEFEPEFILGRAQGLIENVQILYGLEIDTPQIYTDKHRKLIDKKIKDANDGATTKLEIANKYLQASQIHTSDGQNSHDSNVTQDFIRSYNSIVRDMYTDTAMTSSNTLEDIRKYIEASPKSEKALPVFEKIRKGLLFVAVNEPEDIILRNVWNRANHTSNSANQSLIKDAIVDQLADSYDNNSIVCSSGRVNRVISALATLDFDNKVGCPMTEEARKNSAFNFASMTLQREIDNLKTNGNEQERAYAESFETGTNFNDIVVKQNFEQKVVSKIDSYIAENNIKPEVANDIKAGLTF